MSRKKRSVIRTIWFILMALLLVSIILTSVIVFTTEDKVIAIISASEVIILVISLIIAYRLDSKEISRAAVITELNKSYVENNGYLELYNGLQKCFDKECANYANCTSDSECVLTVSKAIVSNYLTFFETIHLLEKSKVISFKVIDDLFAYRFFLAVHSKYVQQIKLKTQPKNFKNIFLLERDWLVYREKEGQDSDPAVRSIYTSRPLKDLIPLDLYNEIVD